MENHLYLPFWDSTRFLKNFLSFPLLFIDTLPPAPHCPALPPGKSGLALHPENPIPFRHGFLTVPNMQFTPSTWKPLWCFQLHQSFSLGSLICASSPTSTPSSSRKLSLTGNNSCRLLNIHSVWGRVLDTVYVLFSFLATVLQNRRC